MLQRANSLPRIDRAALELAMELAREDAGLAEQVESMLSDGRPWERVATHATECQQERNLRLKPWQPAPCNRRVEVGLGDDPALGEKSGWRAASVLLERMLELKISRWHPDPMRAIAEKEIGPS
jgi:hypothetical protein